MDLLAWLDLPDEHINDLEDMSVYNKTRHSDLLYMHEKKQPKSPELSSSL